MTWGEALARTPQVGTVFAILAFAVYLIALEIVRVDMATILIMCTSPYSTRQTAANFIELERLKAAIIGH